MNFLTLTILAVLIQSVDAETEKVATEKSLTVVRVTTVNIEIATSPEEGKLIQERAKTIGGMLVVCESLKLSVTDEGKVLECEGCSFTTPTGITGTAPSAVFDLAKGIVTLAGDDTTQVRLVTPATGENVEQRLVTRSIEMSLPPARPQRTNQGSQNTDDFPSFDPDDSGSRRTKQKPRSAATKTDDFDIPQAVENDKPFPRTGKSNGFERPASVEKDEPTTDPSDIKTEPKQ